MSVHAGNRSDAEADDLPTEAAQHPPPDADARMRDLEDHYSWRQVYRLNGCDPRINRGDSP